MRWVVIPISLATLAGDGARAPIGLSIADSRVVEGDTGDRGVEVTVSLSEVAKDAVTVSYTTKDGGAVAGNDYRAASGTVTFARGEIAKKITLKIIGDSAAETDEPFDVVLGSAAGANVLDGTGTVTIVNDDFPAPGPATYEIRVTFVGSTGSMEGADGCPVRPNGQAVLSGLVSGIDRVRPDEDIEYTGTLHYDVDLDLCEVDQGPSGDTAKLCRLSALGSGPLATELSVNEGDRGGYIKTKQAKGAWLKVFYGSCPQDAIDEERGMFPDGSMANLFDGRELPLKSGPLRVGQYRDGSVTFEVLRKLR